MFDRRNYRKPKIVEGFHAHKRPLQFTPNRLEWTQSTHFLPFQRQGHRKAGAKNRATQITRNQSDDRETFLAIRQARRPVITILQSLRLANQRQRDGVVALQEIANLVNQIPPFVERKEREDGPIARGVRAAQRAVNPGDASSRSDEDNRADVLVDQGVIAPIPAVPAVQPPALLRNEQKRELDEKVGFVSPKDQDDLDLRGPEGLRVAPVVQPAVPTPRAARRPSFMDDPAFSGRPQRRLQPRDIRGPLALLPAGSAPPSPARSPLPTPDLSLLLDRSPLQIPDLSLHRDRRPLPTPDLSLLRDEEKVADRFDPDLPDDDESGVFLRASPDDLADATRLELEGPPVPIAMERVSTPLGEQKGFDEDFAEEQKGPPPPPAAATTVPAATSLLDKPVLSLEEFNAPSKPPQIRAPRRPREFEGTVSRRPRQRRRIETVPPFQRRERLTLSSEARLIMPDDEEKGPPPAVAGIDIDDLLEARRLLRPPGERRGKRRDPPVLSEQEQLQRALQERVKRIRRDMAPDEKDDDSDDSDVTVLEEGVGSGSGVTGGAPQDRATRQRVMQDVRMAMNVNRDIIRVDEAREPSMRNPDLTRFDEHRELHRMLGVTHGETIIGKEFFDPAHANASERDLVFTMWIDGRHNLTNAMEHIRDPQGHFIPTDRVRQALQDPQVELNLVTRRLATK